METPKIFISCMGSVTPEMVKGLEKHFDEFTSRLQRVPENQDYTLKPREYQGEQLK